MPPTRAPRGTPPFSARSTDFAKIQEKGGTSESFLENAQAGKTATPDCDIIGACKICEFPTAENVDLSLGAIGAGTSYQAFGYELKCRGRELCQFTSSFELVYLLLTACRINFLVAASGHTSLGERGRRRLIHFAILDSLAYSIFLLVGVLLPVRFMVSYEGFMAFIGGNFVLMFLLNIRHYLAHRDRLNLRMIWLWIGFLVVNIGYFAALFAGFAGPLYARHGVWFNANDTLRTLLILWAGQIFFSLRNTLSDPSDGPNAGGENPASAESSGDPRPD